MEVDDDIATNSVYHAAPSNIPSLPLVLLCSLVVVTKCYIWVSCCNRHLLCMCSYFTLSLYSQFVCNVSEAIYILSVWNFTIVYVLIKVHVTFTIKPVYNSNDGTICSIYGVFHRQALQRSFIAGIRNSGHNRKVAAFNNEHCMYLSKIQTGLYTIDLYLL